jgi:tetratricopeptide (TPR) repeat protein
MKAGPARVEESFNDKVARLLVKEANDAYMLGSRRSYDGPAGYRKTASGHIDNIEKYTPEQFNKGIKSSERGYISEPPEVRVTAQRISEAIATVCQDAKLKKQLEDILEGYMIKYHTLESNIRRAGRTAEALAAAQKALENAEARKDLERAAKFADDVYELNQQYTKELKDIEDVYGSMEAVRPIIFDELVSIINVPKEMERYKKVIEQRKAQVQQGLSPYYMLYDYIKSFAHFLKNVLHFGLEAKKKHQVVLKSSNLPEKLGMLRNLIKKGPAKANEVTAMELLKSAVPAGNVEEALIKNLEDVIKKFYKNKATESDVIKTIYSLSPANTLR